MSSSHPEPRLALAAEPVPGWLLVVRRFARKTRRGYRRLYHGCWLRHRPDLLRKPQPSGSLYLECPRCDLVVRIVEKDPKPRIRPWDEVAYDRSKNPEKYGNVATGRFTR